MSQEVTPEEGTKPTKEQLLENLKAATLWLTAIERGYFQGQDAVPIATLVDFLRQQKAIAQRSLDAALEDAAAAAGVPTYGQPKRPDVELKHMHPETNQIVSGCDACAAAKPPAVLS